VAQVRCPIPQMLWLHYRATEKSWKLNFYSIQMGTSTVFTTSIPLKFSQIPRSEIRSNQRILLDFSDKFQHGFGGIRFFKAKPRRKLCTKAVLPEIPNQKQYPKMGAKSTGPILPSHLIQVVETAAKTGAEVCFLSSQIVTFSLFNFFTFPILQCWLFYFIF